MRAEWRSLLLLVLVQKSIIVQGGTYLDDEVAVPLNTFQLSYTPSHVVNNVTRDVSLRCAQTDRTQSIFERVTSIHLLKKATGMWGWVALAELRANEDMPTSQVKAVVSGRIDENGFGTFLEITWPVATDETFATFSCQVGGILRNSGEKEKELTPLVDIVEDELNAGDAFTLYKEIDHDLYGLKNYAVEMTQNLSSVNEEFISYTNEIEAREREIEVVTQQAGAVQESFDSVKTEMTAAKSEVESLALSVEKMNDTLFIATGNVGDLRKHFTSINDAIKSAQQKLNTVSSDSLSIKDLVDYLLKGLQSVHETVVTLKADLLTIQNKFDSIAEDSGLTKTKLADLRVDIKQRLTGEMDSLMGQLEAISDQISPVHQFITDKKRNKEIDMISSLTAWPQGEFALLRPKLGCPVDLTFTGQRPTYYSIQTDSSSADGENLDEHPDFLGHWTKSVEENQNILNLWFCEANGVFNTEPWPEGSYCINQLFEIPCPPNFREGHLNIKVESAYSREIKFTSRSVKDGTNLYFCCRDDGSAQEAMTLPARSDFVLYRLGGQCHTVTDMYLTEEALHIDTGGTGRHTLTGTGPDIINLAGSTDPLVMHLCFYEARSLYI